MTRVLIIGNSHAAAIKRAWDAARADFAAVSLDFLVVRQPEFHLLGWRAAGVFGVCGPLGHGARFHAEIGIGEARLETYQTIAVVGANLGYEAALTLFARHDVDGLRQGDPQRPRLSLPAFRAFLRDVADRCTLNGVRSTLRSRSIVAVPRPMRNEAALQDADCKEFAAASMLAARPQGLRAALDLYDEAVRASIGADGFLLLPQPRETLTDFGMTRQEFGVDRNPDYVQPKARTAPDRVHTSDAYGRLVLDALLLPRSANASAPAIVRVDAA